MADWLTFITLYVWVGLWVLDKIDREHKRLNMNDKADRWVPLKCMAFWPIMAVIAPFAKH